MRLPWKENESVILHKEYIYGIGNKNAGPNSQTSSSKTSDPYESLRQHAVNNTVFIVPINMKMMPFADNLLCSLKKIKFDLKQLVFWTLDEKTGDILREKSLNTFHDPALWGVTDFNGTNYFSPEFKRMMKQRPKFLLNLLSTGLDVLFLDTDIIFYDDPFKIVDHSVDLVIGSDTRNFFGPLGTEKDPFQDPKRLGDRVPPVCAGTFWMKSNKHTIKLWQIMIDVFEEDPSVVYLRDKGFNSDQHGLDLLLNDGRANLVEPLPYGITKDMLGNNTSDAAKLSIRMLDQAWVASGHLFRVHFSDYVERVAMLDSKGFGRLAIHLNWDTNEMPKIEGAKKMKIWQLDEHGQCI